MNIIFSTYTNKELIAGILRSFLAVIYISLLALSTWLCRDFSFGYIADRIVPYGLPPLLILLCAAFLSLFVLTLEQSGRVQRNPGRGSLLFRIYGQTDDYFT